MLHVRFRKNYNFKFMYKLSESIAFLIMKSNLYNGFNNLVIKLNCDNF